MNEKKIFKIYLIINLKFTEKSTDLKSYFFLHMMKMTMTIMMTRRRRAPTIMPTMVGIELVDWAPDLLWTFCSQSLPVNSSGQLPRKYTSLTIMLM